uniref:Lariat debranching enzyme C-terminal domain-containing protein n=1 Tax=Globodera rostochiensis TaxID=31243 RepID=A0A914HMD6_GLORO
MTESNGSVGQGAVHNGISMPFWFGFVHVKADGESVQIEDNLSLKVSRFKVPKDGDEKFSIADVGATDRFIFFLGQNAICAFDLRTEMKSPDGSSDEKWAPVEVELNHSEVAGTSCSSAVALSQQFCHWNALRGRKGTDKFQCSVFPKSNRFLVCTAFGAFLATNSGDRAILKRICDSRLGHNLLETKTFYLPFPIQKIRAGRDHLTILDALNDQIWSLGTGTRGELGDGRVEADNWGEGPSFADVGIRCVDIESGAWHSLALTAEGDVYGWGWNGHGQLGQPSSEFSIQPMPFPFDLGDETAIAIRCVGNNSFLLLSGGNELAFGEICADQKIEQKMAARGTDTSVAGGQQSAEIGVEKDANAGGDGLSPAPKRQRQQRLLRMAVVGCSHGQLDAIYDRLRELEGQRNVKFDLVICCGDFQAIRNHGDLQHFHAPFHHRKLGTFYKYYSGEKVAPILTLFVGGNHESSGFMAELPNGGWVAPNIFYMGYASVVRFGGLRIAGLSGIFKPGDYNRGKARGSVVSAYHVRSVDIFRLRHLKDASPPLDIFFSHDWPAGITDFGDWETLLRIKPHFAEDVRANRLGNPATMDLVHELRPAHWFAAHLHVHFTAVVPHSDQPAGPGASVTRFLALDKPNENPRRRFIEFLQFPIAEDAQMELAYDPQWLAILRATDELTECTDGTVFMPTAILTPKTSDIDALLPTLGSDLRIPFNFRHTAPPEREPWNSKGRPPSLYYRNPQTQQFCERLGIRDLNLLFAQKSADFLGVPHFLNLTPSSESQPELRPLTEATTTTAANPDEIDLGVDEFGSEDFIVDVPEEVK